MTESTILDKPVPCEAVVPLSSPLTWPSGRVDLSGCCLAPAYGPRDAPRCATHGGPDVQECESCHKPITDDAEQFDCPRYSGPVHVGCHPADCRSVECREALGQPWEE